MRLLFFLNLFLICLISCTKDNQNNPAECAIPAVVPFQAYSDPVWHPNGQLLGFNHTPQAGVFANGTSPCVWYMNTVKQDSAGFYLMNKDGSGFRRVTNFYLNTPAWSPDGNWITFSIPPHIYKMQFNGYTFDTSHITQLTTTGGNFYPSWTMNSDTIFFDSNNGTNGQGYYVWKMAADGSGKIGFPNTGRQPYVGSNGKVYYVGGFNGQPEVFSMNWDGTGKIQLTFNGQYGNRRSPKFFANNLLYEDNGFLKAINSSGINIQLAQPSASYDVSSGGEIVYSKWDYSVSLSDKQRGTLWIINVNGNNNRQLTFNH